MIRTTVSGSGGTGDLIARLGAEPDLERQEQPQAVPVVGSPLEVLANQRVDKAAIEPLEDTRVGAEVIEEIGAKIAAEPGSKRNTEAHLAAAHESRVEACRANARLRIHFVEAPRRRR